MALLSSFLENLHWRSGDPPSLLQLAMLSLLTEEAWTMAALKDLPVELMPQLFLEAYAHRYTATLKAMVQEWPFHILPLGFFIENLLSECFRINAVLKGLDALLTQKVRSRRCKLEVLDLCHSPHQFWSQWCDVKFHSHSRMRRAAAEGSSGRRHFSASLEVLLDVFLMGDAMDELSMYMVEWAKTRKDVHLCCKRLIFMDSLVPFNVLNAIRLDCIQEVEANFTIPMYTFALFASILGEMKRLQRLLLSVLVQDHGSLSELNGEGRLVTLFSFQLCSLHSLRELCLDSPFFLKGRLDKVLRCLRTPLETLSIMDCPLLEGDLAHLCHCPNLTRLKELSLRGTNLSVVGERLRVLLENCAATLQDLDLGMCRLLDSHLQAILPGLKVCSQLSILNLHWNRVSMATLFQLLRQLSMLPHLIMELYPAPQESYNSLYTLHQRTFDLHCTELREVLRDLGKPRTILLSTKPCSHCGKIIFHNCEPMLFPFPNCKCQIQKISFPD